MTEFPSDLACGLLLRYQDGCGPPQPSAEASRTLRVSLVGAEPRLELPAHLLASERVLHVWRSESGGYELDWRGHRSPGFHRASVSADGKHLGIRWHQATPWRQTPHLLRSVIFGLPLGVALRLRGRVSFHASSAVFAGAGVAFLGPSQRGKSTLAAALHGLGHPVGCEEFAPVTLSPAGEPRLLAGRPFLTLTPEAARLAGVRFQELGYLHTPIEAARDGGDGRRILPLERAQHDWPLKALCLLQPRSNQARVEVKRVSGSRALLGLARNLTANTWLPVGELTPRLAELARRVPVYSVSLPNSLEQLPSACTSLANRLQELVAQ